MSQLENQTNKIQDVLVEVAREVEGKVAGEYNIKIGYVDTGDRVDDVYLLINNPSYYFESSEDLPTTITFRNNVVEAVKTDIKKILKIESDEYNKREDILKGFTKILGELKDSGAE